MTSCRLQCIRTDVSDDLAGCPEVGQLATFESWYLCWNLHCVMSEEMGIFQLFKHDTITELEAD
jgi:hypothetical protein